MELIGKGTFSKVYRKNKKTVIIKSCDPIKECMALGWFPNSRLFPKITRIDFDEVATYEMKYYPKVSSLKKELKPKQYEIYKELRSVMDDIVRLNIDNDHGQYHNVMKAFRKIKNKRLRETMIEALDACGNYGSDIAFEISPRNVAVNNGNLILLDCFFVISKLNEVRSKK